jgi:GTP-binding protein Era
VAASKKAKQEPAGGRPGAPQSYAGPPRAGSVAIIGRPNVGKSTLLNAALEHRLSIVSPTPQTTRDAILGVVHFEASELALVDTPGLHRPRNELGRMMNEAAREAARTADVVVFVAEVPERKGGAAPGAHPGDLTLLADIAADRPTILVINKVDRAKDKSALLPLIEAYGKARAFAAVVPISALREKDVRRVVHEVAQLLPEGPWRHAPDDLTDRPLRFFAAEYVREQILRATQAEVPHAVAIAIDRFVEPADPAGAVHVDATICVEKSGQKRILIGTGGAMLKTIGTKARLRIQELTGKKVNLKLWVRVEPAWRNERARLEELGYRRAGAATEAATLMDLVEEGEDTQ